MRKTFLTIAILAAFAVSTELPICEEFANETNVSCVAGDSTALIISVHADGSKSYEFYKNDKKVYLEYGESYVLASNGRKTLNIDHIPNANTEFYINELLFGLIDELDF